MWCFSFFYFTAILILYVSGDFTESLTWSKTFTYEATLEVPRAGIVEPYKVWVDGKSGNTRVDFYDGLDTFYRHRNYGSKPIFQFYKVLPVTNSIQSEPQRVCHKLQRGGLTEVYSSNTYMPTYDFKFKDYDVVKEVKCQKWVSEMEYNLNDYKVLSTATVWVVQEKVGDEFFAKPLRYSCKNSVGGMVIDEFYHSYHNYTFDAVDGLIFELPEGQSCTDYQVSEHEPIDSLLEFVDPSIGYSRINKAFDSYKLQYKKEYSTDSEHFMRMVAFINNLRYISSQNKKHKTYTLAVNHLADLTENELKVFLGTSMDNNFTAYDNVAKDNDFDNDVNSTLLELINQNMKYHTYFDWRDYNAVNPVKEQTALCGSCYAFATASAVESNFFIQNGFRGLTELSEQAIIDCSWSVNNAGCEGGKFGPTLSWIVRNGLPQKHEYGPYLAIEGKCHHSAMSKLRFIKGYSILTKNIEKMKKTLQKKGPLLVAIDSTPKSFLFYSGGIYNDRQCNSSPQSPNHGVVIVGYGISSDKEEYWIVKNTFGSTWGEDGFMKIAIDHNICGVTNFVYTINAKIKSKT